MKYKTSGVCAREIEFEVVEDKLTSVTFLGGCDGNLKGIGSLVEGMELNEVIKRLKGLGCKTKQTSCPDQLAVALEQYMEGCL